MIKIVGGKTRKNVLIVKNRKCDRTDKEINNRKEKNDKMNNKTSIWIGDKMNNEIIDKVRKK